MSFFGLFKSECPVKGAEKEWIENLVSWFYSALSKKEVLKYSYFSPVDLFSDAKGLQPVAVAELAFGKISAHLQTDFRGKIIFDDIKKINGDEALKDYHYAGSHSISTFKDGEITIYFINEVKRDYDLLARDIFYYILLNKFQLTYGLDPQIGQQMDFATVLFGGYSYLSNSISLYQKWQVGRGYAYRYNSRGYIRDAACAYAIALQHVIEGVPKNFSIRDLGVNVKGDYRRSMAYIKSKGAYYSAFAASIEKHFDDLIHPPDFIREHVTYHREGVPSSVISMKNDMRHGLFTNYYRNGKLRSKSEYREGKIWTVMEDYDPKGNRLDSGDLFEGNGKSIHYDDQGENTYILEYENGKERNNKRISYYQNKQILQIAEMKHGRMNGLTTFYHKNGKLWAKWEYKNNIPWTTVCNFNDKGEEVEKGDLFEGNGVLFSYDGEGRLLYKYHYENGQLINTENLNA